MAKNTVTTTDNWQVVLTANFLPTSVIPIQTMLFSIYEGELSADGSTLTGINTVKYKVQGAPEEKEALYQDLQSEQTLPAGGKALEWMQAPHHKMRVLAKSAATGQHGKVTVYSLP